MLIIKKRIVLMSSAIAVSVLLCAAASGQSRSALRQLALAGDTAAMLQLSQTYRFGKLDAVVNDDSANYYLQQAAQRGHPDAQYLLGIACIRGLGMAQAPQQGLKYLKMAASQQHRLAMDALWQLHSKALTEFGPSPIPVDFEAAAGWATKAAAAGSENAAYFLAEMLQKGAKGVPRNDSLAIYWLGQAAIENGFPPAQLLLARWHFSGETQAGINLQESQRLYALVSENPRADFEQQAAGAVGLNNVRKAQRRAYNFILMMGFIDPQTAPPLRFRL